MLHRLINDFDDFVFPLFPLVDPDSCHELLNSGAYNTDPAFLCRCMALCAITVASAPNKESEYCISRYATYQSFVNRACDLITMSRLATQNDWEDSPCFETAIDTILLSLAAHYSGRTRRGWALMNEGMLIMRDLQLHRAEGLSKLSSADAERCRRAFWILYLTQMLVISLSFASFVLTLRLNLTLDSHDLLISPTPHMLPGFPPRNTNWQAMELSDMPRECMPTALTGFVQQARLLACVRDILSTRRYQECLTPLLKQISPLGLNLTHSEINAEPDKVTFTGRIAVAHEIIARLQEVIDEASSDLAFAASNRGAKMAIITVHVTGLYMSTALIDAIFSGVIRSRDSEAVTLGDDTASVHATAHTSYEPDETNALGAIRESIAQRLLDVLHKTPRDIIELNGFSLVRTACIKPTVYTSPTYNTSSRSIRFER